MSTIKSSAEDLILNADGANNDVIIQSNASTKVTVDGATGSVGIGVVPESWRTNDFIGLQVGSGAAVYGRGSGDEDQSGLTANAYYDNSNDRWQYIVSKAAAKYAQISGVHYFYVASSGTADAAISWTSAMTITNDGRGLSEFTAKAWVNFNGTGTVAIRDSHNVSSITDNGTGYYHANFTNAMSDLNYVTNLSTHQTVTWSGTTGNDINVISASYVSLVHRENGATTDPNQVSAVIFSS